MSASQQVLPVCAIIPTRNRAVVLRRTLESLLAQDAVPQEIVIIDASSDDQTERALHSIAWPAAISVKFERARVAGAAHQRTQGLDSATAEYIAFFDDDIVFEPECIRKLFEGFRKNPSVGGVNAMITNQKYTSPGRVTRFMYRLMDRKRDTWAGLVIGPAWNLLPEDRPELPEWVPVEWLNTTCTIYKRSVLPSPLFPPIFNDYSLFEDLTLSLLVGRSYQLLNARTARIFHDSQPADYKKNAARMAEMETVNRYFVMTAVLHRTSIRHRLQFYGFLCFGTVSSIFQLRSFSLFIANIRGKIRGLIYISRERIGRNRI